LWSFIGIETATTDASLVRDPQRTIPKATMIGSGIAAFVYFASCTAISGMFAAKDVAASGAPFSLATSHILGPWTGHVVSAFVAFGCLTSLGSWMMLVAQAGARTAHDDMLPKIFGRLSKKNIPSAGIILTAVLMTALMGVLMIFSKEKSAQSLFGNIISIAVLLTILPYFYSALNMLHAFEMKKNKIFLQLLACFLSVGFCLVAIAGSPDEILVATVAVSFIAMVFYERKDRSGFEKKIYDEIKRHKETSLGL
jgi:cadaverine:lysine antiporter